MNRIFSLLLLGGLLFSACHTTPNPPRVAIETSLGTIVAEIYPVQAPIAGGNFLDLIDRGLYNRGTAAFYRVTRPDNQPNNEIKIDVIQGGLRGDSLAEKLTPIPHETTKTTCLRHLDGSLSMARAEPGSATSEFFICIGDQPELDFGGRRNPDGQGFSVFGKVLEGMEIVREIQGGNDQSQYLTEPVSIFSIRRLP